MPVTTARRTVTPEAVRDLRLARGQTVTQAAAAARVARRTWYRWEQGECPPHDAILIVYALEHPTDDEEDAT